MNDVQIQPQTRIPTAFDEFVSEASDLYVDFLSEGRRSLATSLLSGIVLVLASLERLSKLPAGHLRTNELRRAATLFHKLSLVIYLSAIQNEEADGSEAKTLHAYDTAADLSGLLASAARRG